MVLNAADRSSIINTAVDPSSSALAEVWRCRSVLLLKQSLLSGMVDRLTDRYLAAYCLSDDRPNVLPQVFPAVLIQTVNLKPACNSYVALCQVLVSSVVVGHMPALNIMAQLMTPEMH